MGSMTIGAPRAVGQATRPRPTKRGTPWAHGGTGSSQRHPWRATVALILGIVVFPGSAAAGERALERQAERVEAMILRVKPAVVGILAEVGAEVTIHCGKNETYVVNFKPDTENGTGFIIHPDGWIATNGHVVESVYKEDEQHITEFLEAAADAACKPSLAKLPAKRRTARMDAILQDPANRQGVQLHKRLEVFFPKRVAPGTGIPPGVPAVVKAYSPPIDPSALAKDGVAPPKDKQMLDGALIKVEMTDLPTVPLAPRSRHLHLGQDLFIIGYPGAVLWHDFLSTESRGAPSVTYGRISGFKLDVNERWVIQTDASISWGNSGGPAFNRDGEVIGLATFITTSLEGDQAIQGFNFLIPIATIQQMAQAIGLTPQVGDPFMQAWEQAVAAYFQGDFAHAAERAEAADTFFPGLWDVQRLRFLLKDLEEFQKEVTPPKTP